MVKFAHVQALVIMRFAMNWHSFVRQIHRETSRSFVISSIMWLVSAAILSGLIGIERESKNRAAVERE